MLMILNNNNNNNNNKKPINYLKFVHCLYNYEIILHNMTHLPEKKKRKIIKIILIRPDAVDDDLR